MPLLGEASSQDPQQEPRRQARDPSPPSDKCARDTREARCSRHIYLNRDAPESLNLFLQFPLTRPALFAVRKMLLYFSVVQLSKRLENELKQAIVIRMVHANTP